MTGHPMSNNILPFLIYLIQIRNAGGLEHSDGVTMLSARIAGAAGIKDHQFLRDLDFAARVHDIGKLAISDAVINKPGRVTKNEMIAIQQHPVVGMEMLRLLNNICENNNEVNENVLQIVGQHHENYDGTGYPHGISGDNIHLGARIIRIADTFNAMTAPYRIYRHVLKHDAAIRIMKDCRKDYDPNLFDVFLEVFNA